MTTTATILESFTLSYPVNRDALEAMLDKLELTIEDVKGLGVEPFGVGYRVGVRFAGLGRHREPGFRSLKTAAVRAVELQAMRKAGLSPAHEKSAVPTLGEAADALLKSKIAFGGKRGPLSDDGVDYWTLSTKPWREGPLAETPLTRLSKTKVVEYLAERAKAAPTSARNERQAFLAALELADYGDLDAALLRLPHVKIAPRKLHALAVDELEFFVGRVPSYARRLPLMQGTVGNRIEELFLAEPDHWHLDDGMLFVPAANCKEGRDKWVPLTEEEVELAREQLGGLHVVTEAEASSKTAKCPAMPPGSRYTFTSKEGRPWRHSQFDKLVWRKACRDAAADWRELHGLEPKAATPFEWYVDPKTAPPDGRRRKDDDGRRTITTHDLRATAVTMMRDAGMGRDEAAARVGHADDGKLVAAVYDQGDRATRAKHAIATAAPQGLRRHLHAESAPRRSTTPAEATADSATGSVSE